MTTSSPVEPAADPVEPPTHLPLMVDVRGRRVLVVGGGPVGVRRARHFRAYGAEVTLVTLDPPAESLPSEVRVERRPVVESDLEGAWLVVLATDDPEVQGRLANAARSAGILVNRADAGRAGDVIVPSVHHEQGVTVAVANELGSPRLSVWFRHRIAGQFDALLGAPAAELARFLSELPVLRRGAAERHEGGPGHARADWQSRMDGTILDLIRNGRSAEAKERLSACR